MTTSEDHDQTLIGRKRRSWTHEEKRRFVEESLEGDASVAEVARRHDLNANQLFAWRRQFGVGFAEPKNLVPILPVTIAPEVVDDLHKAASGQMEIILAQGERIIVWSDVDAASLTAVLKALSQR